MPFDKNYAGKVYRKYNEEKSVDNNDVENELTAEFCSKKVLLAAPGKSVGDAREKIAKYIA